MELRDYQNEAIDAVCSAYDQHWRQMILSMATGSGKTVVFSQLYERLKSRLPGKMLILAHREELIDQAISTMQTSNPSLRIGKEMAGYIADPSTADVIVAGVATLGRKNTSRLEKFNPSDFSTVIVDEAHHTLAESYMRILEAFHVLEDRTSKLLLGFTATPFRSDGRPLGEIYKKMVYVYSLRQAISAGWLAEVRGYRVTTHTDLSGVTIAGGDFNKTELEAAINTPERNKAIVEAWQKYGESRPSVAFVAGVEHARSLSEAFNAAGVPSEAIWGEDPDRTAKLDDFRARKIKVLANCNVLTEGVDIPLISCILLARPTQSSVLFTQMVGRSTRLCPGKTDAIVLDMVDISGSHSLITLPMLMGLPGGLDLQGHSLTEAAGIIEAMQEENPAIDFTKLKTINNLKHFVEEVNLFTLRFPAEVESNSDLTWARACDGSFILKVPKLPLDTTDFVGGKVRIFQNLLDKWEVEGCIDHKGFHGLRGSVEEAFACADQQIRERAPASVTLINRKAGWMNKPATKNQMTMLSRLYGKAHAWPEGFTAGQASHWIDKRIGGKK